MSEENIEWVSDLLYNYSGNISIHKGNNFGIINGKKSVFVTTYQIKKNQLLDVNSVKGLAMPNFDKKKKVWGWRLIKLNN